MSKMRINFALFATLLIGSFGALGFDQKSVETESAEYFEKLRELDETVGGGKSSLPIGPKLSEVFKEGQDVSDALLRDEEATTRKRATESYPYALLVDAGYHFPIEKVPGYERLEQEELPESWQRRFIPKKSDSKYPNGKGMLINDKESSLWASVFKNTKNDEIVLVLRGAELRPTNVRDFVRNARTVAEHWLGQIPTHFEKAFDLANALKQKYPQKTLVVTGSSLGGSLALFTGLSLGTKVYAFNALGLNSREISFISKRDPDAFGNVDEQVTLVSITGDMVSDGSEILPRSFVNSYFGTIIKIPFYDDSWKGYYMSNHHTSEAIVNSLEVYLKKGLAKNAIGDLATSNSDDMSFESLAKDLELDEFKVINRSGSDVRVLVFSCTSGSGFGMSTTFCHESMFAYPHRNFDFVESMSVLKAQSKIPGLSVALSDKPLIARDLEIGKVDSATIRIPKTSKMSWPNDYFTKNQWLYVTAMNLDSKCRAGQQEPYIYLGTPFYSGQWPSTLLFGKTLGWLLPESRKNPKVLVISHFGKDACSFELKGY